MTMTIQLPGRFNSAVAADSALHAGILKALADFTVWFSDNKVVFFPGFTDHGPTHIEEVLRTAEWLVTEKSWQHVTPQDVVVLTLGILLHDSAMHLSKEGFLTLLADGQRAPRTLVPHFPDDLMWSLLWEQFFAEARHFDERSLKSIFGTPEPVRALPPNVINWSERDCLLVGEFLRRHHTRLAWEFALFGVPGTDGRTLRQDGIAFELRALAGLVARSHGMSIRAATDALPAPHTERRRAHVPYLMAVLRIADYFQIHPERAPASLLELRGLRSSISRAEWAVHRAVRSIHAEDEDPEALFVEADPSDCAEYLKLRRLLDDIQRELDESWALLGQVYGRHSRLADFGLSVRRIRSDLDNLTNLADRVEYLPRKFAFGVAPLEILNLLIEPLYSFDRSAGYRELLQNAVDACREAEDLTIASTRRDDLPDVAVRLEVDGQTHWLEIQDVGVGMTADVVHDYFLKAGASFRNSDLWKRRHEDETGRPRLCRAGRFGIGVLAAFLLGERLRVSTRSRDQAIGISFECGLEDREIEVRKCERVVGTTIRVRLRPDAVKSVSESLTTWYALTRPRVRYWGPDGSEWQQSNAFPAPGADPLPPGWGRTHIPDLLDVQWAYSADSAGWYHNGILVASPSASEDISPDFTWFSPTVSYFDPDGVIPLNLQRTGFGGGMPFRVQIRESILRELTSELSRSCREHDWFSYQVPHWIEHLNLLTLGRHFRAIGMSRHGLFLLHPEVVARLPLSSISVVLSRGSEDARRRVLTSSSEAIVRMEGELASDYVLPVWEGLLAATGSRLLGVRLVGPGFDAINEDLEVEPAARAGGRKAFAHALVHGAPPADPTFLADATTVNVRRFGRWYLGTRKSGDVSTPYDPVVLAWLERFPDGLCRFGQSGVEGSK